MVFSLDELKHALFVEPAKKPEPQAKAYLMRSSFKKIAPAIYSKALVPSLSKKEQKQKVFELLEWFAKKQDLVVSRKSAIQYWMDKQKHDGRLEMTLSDTKGAPMLAIEVRWDLDRTTGHKLQAAFASGFKPLLIVLEPVASEAFNQFSASFKVHEKSPHWLCLCTPSLVSFDKKTGQA